MNLNQVKGIVSEIATKAKSSAKHVVAKKMQKPTEEPEKLKRSMDAMDARGRALVIRSKKAAAAKTGTKTINKTAAETAQKAPEEKLMDLVTGKKANKSAQESAELMNADAAYKAAIGEQANKSAIASAAVFKVQGNTEKGKALEKALTEAERKAEYLKNPEFAEKLANKRLDEINSVKIEATKARLQKKYGK